MRALLVGVAAALVLTGCGSESPTATQPSTGITGHVLLGPTCPVENAASPCPDQAAPAGVRVTVSKWRAQGALRIVATTETGADGEFQVPLRPGKYVVQADAGMFCKPIDVLVPDGQPTHVEVTCDTGIR
jgi:hypothetical protein